MNLHDTGYWGFKVDSDCIDLHSVLDSMVTIVPWTSTTNPKHTNDTKYNSRQRSTSDPNKIETLDMHSVSSKTLVNWGEF